MTATDPALRDLALFGDTAPGDPIALRHGRVVSRAAMLADAERLAAQLPARGIALNYCSDRYRFLCALVAALLRGQLTLLPQDRSAGTIDMLAARHAGLYALCDGAERPARVPAVEVEAEGAAGHSGAMPAVPAGQPAVTLFTSGSTGQPMPHTRDWRWLVAGARHYYDAFGLARLDFAHIVGTVPPQHSFGLESTILLPLLRPLAIVARTPFFTGDIERILAAAPAPRVLVTAPIHIQALVRARAQLPALALIVSATAPLAADVAAAAERAFATEQHEVYGCSEIGLVATRRTVKGNRWRLPADMTVAIDGDTAQIEAPHLPQPMPLADIVQRLDARHMALVGRRADMINIAGKRASLSGLNAILASLPGVQDGAFFVPDENTDGDAAGTARPIALVVAPELSAAAIRRMLRARMDSAFVPRAIHRVDRLPRDQNGKLPTAALADLARRLDVRRPRLAAADETAAPAAASAYADAATFVVAADHPALAGHFPGHPIVPGAVILDYLVAAAAAATGEEIGEIAQAKFLRPLASGETCRIAVDLRAAPLVRVACGNDAGPVASAVLRLKATP